MYPPLKQAGQYETRGTCDKNCQNKSIFLFAPVQAVVIGSGIYLYHKICLIKTKTLVLLNFWLKNWRRGEPRQNCSFDDLVENKLHENVSGVTHF